MVIRQGYALLSARPVNWGLGRIAVNSLSNLSAGAIQIMGDDGIHAFDAREQLEGHLAISASRPANEPTTDDQEGLIAFWRSGL